MITRLHPFAYLVFHGVAVATAIAAKHRHISKLCGMFPSVDRSVITAIYAEAQGVLGDESVTNGIAFKAEHGKLVEATVRLRKALHHCAGDRAVPLQVAAPIVHDALVNWLRRAMDIWDPLPFSIGDIAIRIAEVREGPAKRDQLTKYRIRYDHDSEDLPGCSVEFDSREDAQAELERLRGIASDPTSISEELLSEDTKALLGPSPRVCAVRPATLADLGIGINDDLLEAFEDTKSAWVDDVYTNWEGQTFSLKDGGSAERIRSAIEAEIVVDGFVLVRLDEQVAKEASP